MTYTYRILGETYDTGSAEPLQITFEAKGDMVALIKMFAIAFTSLHEVEHIVTYDGILDFLIDEFFTEDQWTPGKDIYDAAYRVFDDINREGGDRYTSLQNVDTGDFVWGGPDDD